MRLAERIGVLSVAGPGRTPRDFSECDSANKNNFIGELLYSVGARHLFNRWRHLGRGVWISRSGADGAQVSITIDTENSIIAVHRQNELDTRSLAENIRHIAAALVATRRAHPDFDAPSARTVDVDGAEVTGMSFTPATMTLVGALVAPKAKVLLTSIRDAERTWLEAWFTARYNQEHNADERVILFKEIAPN